MAEIKSDPFDLASGVPAIEGELRPKPKFADRISKRVVLVAYFFVAVLVVIFIWSIGNMDEKKTAPAVKKKGIEKSEQDGGAPVPKEFLNAAPRAGVAAEPGSAGVAAEDKPRQHGTLVEPAVSMFSPSADAGKDGKTGKGGVPAPGGTPETAGIPGAGGVPAMSGNIPKAEVVPPPLTPQQQAAAQAKTERMARLAQARSGGLSAKSFEGEGAATAAASGAAAMQSELLTAAKNAANGQAQAGMAPAAPPAPRAAGGEQDEKLDFLKEAGKDNRGYHPFMPVPALSKNEVKVGTYIPLELEMGINSDLPGEITARSSEAIYDSVTGCRELIPPMTKFVGRYDSKVALGQGRILVTWNSAIFADGAELNLAGMQGYDSSGQAGLQSEVDNHYWRLFGLTFGMSILTATTQMSVPPSQVSATGVSSTPTAAQAVSTALAQQYGQLGAQILGKYINVQPTLRNFVGERFTIMVPHTIVFKKVWSNRCRG